MTLIYVALILAAVHAAVWVLERALVAMLTRHDRRRYVVDSRGVRHDRPTR